VHRVTRRRLSGLLALLCAAEIALAVATWRDRATAGVAWVAGVPAAKPAKMRLGSGLEAVPLETFSAFVARPLFLASRRPPPSAAAASSGTANMSAKGVIFGPYKFTGIVITPRVRIAFVTEIGTGKSIALAEGEMLGDWRCAKITPGGVTLERGDRREVIELHATR